MASWSEGYFTDVQYTGRFYPFMAPGYLRIGCLIAGLRAPHLGSGSTYLELGCGQGFGVNLLAAANPQMSFVGVDFHPGQIANAQRLAAETGLGNVRFEDWSFAQMLALPAKSLPRVDVVALHGVLSWVSDENRARIVAIIDRVLKPGGLVYVSYNALPGWEPQLAVRRLLADHFARAVGSPEARLAAALKTLKQLADADARYFRRSPAAKQIVERIQTQTPAYLFHEYLNADYHAFFHADVARELEAAKLAFAASAVGAEDIAGLAAPASLEALMREAEDPAWRQTLFDYAGDKSFRKDIFVRGRNGLDPAEQMKRLADTRFALLTPAASANLEFQVPIGTLAGDPAVYRPILERLARGPAAYGEIKGAEALRQTPENVVRRALVVLLGAAYVHPLQDQPDAGAQALNRVLLARLDEGDATTHLSSARVGTGVRVTASDLFGLRAALAKEDAASAARQGLAFMARAGAALQKDGKAITDPTAAEAEFVRRIEAFRASKLPLLEQLGAV